MVHTRTTSTDLDSEKEKGEAEHPRTNAPFIIQQEPRPQGGPRGQPSPIYRPVYDNDVASEAPIYYEEVEGVDIEVVSEGELPPKEQVLEAEATKAPFEKSQQSKGESAKPRVHFTEESEDEEYWREQQRKGKKY